MARISIIPTPSGSVAVTGHGFGVELRGVYTPNELYTLSGLHEPAEKVERPPLFDEYYNFAWCPWTRRSLDAFSRICERTRMVTQLRLHEDDVHASYAGTGKPYKDAWQLYYPLQTRLDAITTGLGVQSPRGTRVLDLGCAAGRPLLGYHAHGMDVYGIEANPEHVRDAPELIKPRIITGDALVDTYVFKANTFNVIICSVLGTTSFPDVEHLFRECHRLLVQDGLIILDMPTRFHIGPDLSADYHTYTKVLRQTGFRATQLFRQQVLARKK